MLMLEYLKNTGLKNLHWGCMLFLLLSSPLVATAELVLHLPLEDAANPVDVSASPAKVIVHGTLNSVEATIDNGLEFNGNNANRIEVENTPKLEGMSALSIAAWIKPRDMAAQEGMSILSKRIAWGDSDTYNVFIWQAQQVEARVNGAGPLRSPTSLEDDTWYHITYVFDVQGNTGEKAKIYIDGVLEIAGDHPDSQVNITGSPLWIGELDANRGFAWNGILDEVRIYNHALSEVQILSAMLGKPWPYAISPDPADGASYSDTWISLSWTPGELAASHDVYLGDNFNDVNEANRDSATFWGNQTEPFLIAGFFGYPYPDGLIPGTTYYWRIDEVNDSEPESPWKGEVWSFSIPPKTAYNPDPADGDELVDINVQLKWTTGFGAKLHYVVFGESFEEVDSAAIGIPSGTTSYTPGALKLAKTYYWRVDEFDGIETYKGQVWSFTTEGSVSGPNPADGAEDVSPTQILTWIAGAVAASHEVYFGTDADAVANATKASPEYKEPKALGDESYDPGKLMLNMAYYWRIDEVNDASPDSPWAGNVWSFTIGNYFVIDDFEHYDANDNQIWFSWHDGLGYGTPGAVDFFAGNGTGAAVGDENSPSYTEETIVNGGNQSMPVAYDNNKQGYSFYSEVEHTLTNQRDWTEQGVAELSIWFRGNPASVGSFIEAPVGTYTMTASGADIWGQADEFHFAYKMLTGAGSIVAKVESVERTDNWAKAGVMIRETLDAGSKFAAVYITPTAADGTSANGCRFQARTDTDAGATSDTSVATAEQTSIIAPYWVKLERDVGGNFRGYYSANGANWTSMSWNPQFITMSSNVYVGLALTSHNAAATCEAVFSNVTTTGNVTGQWVNQDIGIESNDPEPLYVALSNKTGASVVVVNDDPTATNIETWTKWVIPLSTFADQGIVLTDVDKIAIGLGTQGNMTVPSGKGKMFIDDIRLYQLRQAAE
jgi:hypothetical protein